MKLVADPIYVPDNADWQTIEGAKAKAMWHEVLSREELMKKTCLDGKCGSCKHFCPKKYETSTSFGKCTLKCNLDYRARTTPACKEYERKTDEQRNN